MAVTSTQNMKLESVETISTGLDPGGESDTVELIHNIITSSEDEERVLDADSTPAASKVWADRVQLEAGALTIDLTSLAGPFSTTVDFTGLRLQQIHIKAVSGNSYEVFVGAETSNGYNIFGAYGATEGYVGLEAGDEVMMRYTGSLAPVVSGSAKDLRVWSDDVDAYLDFHLVAG